MPANVQGMRQAGERALSRPILYPVGTTHGSVDTDRSSRYYRVKFFQSIWKIANYG